MPRIQDARSISCGFFIKDTNILVCTHYRGFETSIIVQVYPSKTRRQIFQSETILVTHKLETGRRRGVTMNPIEYFFKFLMYMPKQYIFQSWKFIYNFPEFICIRQTKVIEPAAANRNRLMMKESYRMVLWVSVQTMLQIIQLMMIKIALNRTRFM